MAVAVTGPYSVGTDGYTYYKFTGAGSTTWSVPSDCSSVDVTVVGAGGGTKPATWNSSGGGGYMVSRFNQSVSGSVTVVVGAGAVDTDGGQSSFGSIVANGGNKAPGTQSGANGGSGGGGGGRNYGGDGGSNGSAGATGEYAGGTGQGTGSTENNPSPCSGTTGIDGILRCGGGGGVHSYGTNQIDRGLGGSGGGGDGGMTTSIAGTNGADDYGGGAGGSYASGAGAGGSGIVIVRYIPRPPKKRGQPHINSGGVLII